jgi:neutral ceramidase
MARLLAGAARRSLPTPNPRAEMLGWGVPDGRCETVHTELQVRALVLAESPESPPLVMVLHEQCMAAWAVREAVLEALRVRRPNLPLHESQLLLAANHTHAAPGGYTHDLFYTLTNPGFDPTWFDALVDASVAAISEALDRLSPAELHFGRSEMSASDHLARNRSPEAYARNRSQAPAVALDRSVLLVRHSDGTPLAAVDWWGVHGTCVHSDQRAVHPDNKGMAARALEAKAADVLGAPDFVALYFQGAAGDISPNTRYDRERRKVVGELSCDFAHAERHGAIQADGTDRAWQSADVVLSGPLDSSLQYLDFDGLAVDADLADGRARRTAHGLVGLAFLNGTAEGPGPLLQARSLGTGLARLKHAMGGQTGQGSKLPFCEVGRGREGMAFGFLRMSPPLVPGLDPVVSAVSRLTTNGGLGDAPWIANRQPVQVLRIGTLAIVAVSGEPTTHAGRMLALTARRSLRACGVEQVVVCGYANAFSGYITTAAEYSIQAYEGGHTLYGPWTLAGWRTGVRRLARRLATSADARPTDVGLRPDVLPPEVLAARRFPC